MLPQFVPLEAREAGTPGKARNGLGHIAGLQRSRGETRPQGGRLSGLLTEHKISRREQVKMVYVLDKRKKPLMPCSHKRAGQLLEPGRARVHKRFPFTIRLVDRLQPDSVLQPLTLKIDPGSKTTGIALAREAGPGAEVVSLIELEHRGEAIKKKLR